MKKPISYEIYKAFAQTKPTEFDSFHRNWIIEHPVIIEDVTEIKPQKRSRRKKEKLEEVIVATGFIEEVPEDLDMSKFEPIPEE